MNEDLLHHVWNFQLFNSKGLKTTEGELVAIIRSGAQNFDSGPDFFNGQVSIGTMLWVGNIEIHIKSSDWIKHKHQHDAAYSKIILHVVWEDDQPVIQKNGERVPTIELSGLVKKSIFDKFEILQNSRSWIPCESEIADVDEFVKIQTIERKLVERLEAKSNRLNQILMLRKNDWEATLYQLLAKYFGFKVNAVPFELLANSIGFNIIRKYRTSEEQLLALFFGQADFLQTEFSGSFPLSLQKKYEFLASKYSLQPLQKDIWKFMRMRPSNFPTIRLAQFVSLFVKNSNLFQAIIEAKNINDLQMLFKVEAHSYFDTHYRFDVPASKNQTKCLGSASIDILLINAVIPVLFNYGKHIASEKIKSKALEFLQAITLERNSIMKKWKKLGMPISSAFDSQALIQLKNEDCSSKKCLTCAIGSAILKPAINDQ